jgi:hypothetical protein
MEEGLVKERVWWWFVVWKLECALKPTIFLWLALDDKILT